MIPDPIDKATDGMLPAPACSPSSDTPETDSIDTSQKARSWEVAYWHMREHARKLERERDAAIYALREIDRLMTGDESYEHAWANWPAIPEQTPALLVRNAISENV